MKFISLILVAALALTGCLGPNRNGRSLDELSRGTGEAESYRVRPGDVLSIDVYGETALTGERVVRDDGQLSMKFVGDIRVQGMTLEEVGKKIEEDLTKYLPAPTVSVNLSRSAPIKYYLSGKFVKAGEYRSDGKITFLQAIATGGNFQPFADESAITLIRRTQTGELRYVLDYNRVVRGGEPNPELRDGDIISIGQ